jgi:mono/diheme cytochrome c family protein
MKRWQLVALGLTGIVVLAASGGVGYVQVNWNRSYDHIEGPDLAVSTEPEVIRRGQYLVEGPAHCSYCHVASMDESARADAGEAIPMRGGVEFALGPLGTIYPSNLTTDAQTGIGRHTDRQLFRMLRHGIKPDGTASLLPLMPFQHMADDDLVAIVSYLRSLPPVRHEVPPPSYTMLGRVIRATTPLFQPLIDHSAARVAPAEAPTAERGEYVARYVANCMACHTRHDMASGRFTGPEFAGGAEFPAEPGTPGYEPGLTFYSPNLTPHPTSVLSRFPTAESWTARFRAGRVHAASPMPWGPFSRMSDEDLEALWVFLNSLEPVENDVGPTVVRAPQ